AQPRSSVGGTYQCANQPLVAAEPLSFERTEPKRHPGQLQLVAAKTALGSEIVVGVSKAEEATGEPSDSSRIGHLASGLSGCSLPCHVLQAVRSGSRLALRPGSGARPRAWAGNVGAAQASRWSKEGRRDVIPSTQPPARGGRGGGGGSCNDRRRACP